MMNLGAKNVYGRFLVRKPRSSARSKSGGARRVSGGASEAPQRAAGKISRGEAPAWRRRGGQPRARARRAAGRAAAADCNAAARRGGAERRRRRRAGVPESWPPACHAPDMALLRKPAWRASSRDMRVNTSATSALMDFNRRPSSL